MANNNEVVFLPLGGVGEIGRNLGLYGYGPEGDKKWIMVDCGISFPGEDLPGVDAVLPDISYILEERNNLMGIFLTHCHEDHYGAVLDFIEDLDVDIYATKFTAGMLRSKLSDYPHLNKVKIKIVKENSTIPVGLFKVTYVPVAHSIPESNSLLIEIDQNDKPFRIFHSGDLRIDESPVIGNKTDLNQLKEIGDKGLDVLICDSTNACRKGSSISESKTKEVLEEVISKCKGAVAVTTFASNVARINSIIRAANKSGRKVFLVGRTMERITQVASECGYLDKEQDFMPLSKSQSFARKETLYICTGSQGQSNAVISRAARNDHPKLKFSEGDTVLFSSRTIPGNEKPVGTAINNLIGLGVEVITVEDAEIHVSGHPKQDELTMLYNALRPSLLVPVHGENLHMLCQKKLALSCGIKNVLIGNDGDLFKFYPQSEILKREVSADILVRDGNLIGYTPEMGVTQRVGLANAGCLLISILVSGKSRNLKEISVDGIGIPDLNEVWSNKFSEDTRKFISSQLTTSYEKLPVKKKSDSLAVKKTLKRTAQSAVYSYWKKRPLCVVNIFHIN